MEFTIQQFAEFAIKAGISVVACFVLHILYLFLYFPRVANGFEPIGGRVGIWIEYIAFISVTVFLVFKFIHITF